MDPCPFVRLVVGSLSLRFSGGGAGNPPPPSCYCKIKLKNFTTQMADIGYCAESDVNQVNDQVQACFNFKKLEFDKVVEKSNGLKIEVYSGGKGNPICGVGSGKLIGVVSVGLDSKVVDNGGNNWGCVVVQNGWVVVGDGSSKKSVQLHLNVRVEPDPRFVFEFDGEPECSPQVFQVNGNVRQAVFTCKFSFRNSGDRNLRSGSSISEANNSGNWLRSVRNDKEKPVKERKGWSITIHDLSGSPVAMASMVTPFVPSHGTDDVRRSNPGAWLILRPGQSTWKPWGRLEAWRESTGGNHLGYRFELLPDAAVGGLDPITLSNSTISSKHGGKFTIDIGNGASPMTTPSGSFDSGSGSDFWSGSWAHLMYQGFVMSSKVAGGGRCSRPEVEIGVQHVTCTEDAAAFVALAAAVDLSVDACRPFSRKLRKELRHDGE
ncbi:uncharacterized protein LOC112507918 [Cynara cardunculus var. scolymus]|uniref:Uncharacterized protein n=1 Tax=Cynara cardunculus var. scolymus TaxID=59895 RepID=A0A103YKT1_CYNCS|nr:uncharacterized protein LOC112507918 [Cynara cardunculus var. scolymus]KVI10855.1 Protein of unknown function DUF1005 [Cynara cardunculus var. scolymus]